MSGRAGAGGGSGADGDRAAARARHPSSRWPVDLGRLQRRVAGDLAAAGHPWPAGAAAILALRGRLGLDRARFARLVDLPVDLVAALEDGDVAGAGGAGSALRWP